MEVNQLRLIEEVQNRPQLWFRKRKKMEKLWAEVANILQSDVSTCKRTWQITRIRFWVESKRIKIRIAKAKERGVYDPFMKYTAWPLFEKLRFLENVQWRNRRKDNCPDDNGDRNEDCIEDISLPIESNSSSQIIAVDDSENSEKKNSNFDSYTIYTEEGECITISNDNNALVKVEPELQLEPNIYCTTDVEDIKGFQVSEIKSLPVSGPEPSQCLQVENAVEAANCTLKVSEDSTSRSPDTSDHDYSFLYSFLSQTKQMSPLQKNEFHAKMKRLLLDIIPASASVNILEHQLLLDETDNDPDKKFLISFWPFIKSMSLSQNLEFRFKMADLVMTILSTKLN